LDLWATTGAAANAHVPDTAGVIRRSTSSLRYKQDVQDAEPGLLELLQLRPVTYRSDTGNDDRTIRYLGFVAEEVAEVIPTGVNYVPYTSEVGAKLAAKGVAPELIEKYELTGRAPDYVQYDRLTAPIVNAIKELNDKLTVVQTSLGQIQPEDEAEGIMLSDIRSISSVDGKWSISEEGQLKVANIEVGSAEEPNGVTLYDLASKQPYCVVMNNGNLEKHSGRCEDVVPTLLPPPPVIEEESGEVAGESTDEGMEEESQPEPEIETEPESEQEPETDSELEFEPEPEPLSEE
jgi:hypothetical protein